jgi:hypothetical protein
MEGDAGRSNPYEVTLAGNFAGGERGVTVDLTRLLGLGLSLGDWQNLFKLADIHTEVFDPDLAAARICSCAVRAGIILEDPYDHYPAVSGSVVFCGDGDECEAIRRTILDKVAPWDRTRGPSFAFWVDRGEDGRAGGCAFARRIGFDYGKFPPDPWAYGPEGMLDPVDGILFEASAVSISEDPYTADDAFSFPRTSMTDDIRDFRSGADDLDYISQFYRDTCCDDGHEAELVLVDHAFDDALVECVVKPLWSLPGWLYTDDMYQASELLDSIAWYNDPARVCEYFGVQDVSQLVEAVRPTGELYVEHLCDSHEDL